MGRKQEVENCAMVPKFQLAQVNGVAVTEWRRIEGETVEVRG